MALDMAKYRALFLEEATEHLAEMSRALIELEKDPAAIASIDLVFRMAHSIKSMAASVGHDAIADIAHALEDRMESVRSSGRLEGEGGLSALFRGLEGLERMVAVVRAEDRSPEPDPELVALLQAPPQLAPGVPPEKKGLS
jgi:two-component system chemotaxis sensor kinase CheA